MKIKEIAAAVGVDGMLVAGLLLQPQIVTCAAGFPSAASQMAFFARIADKKEA